MGVERLDEERQHRTVLLSEGDDGDKGAPVESAAVLALRSKRELALDHGAADPSERPPGRVTIEPKDVSLADAQRRWADLLRRICEVDPLLCPTCGGAMRVIAPIQEPKVIDKIVRHLRAKGPGRARRPVGDRAAGGRAANEAA